jgi:Flp pilus assembly protein TadB
MPNFKSCRWCGRTYNWTDVGSYDYCGDKCRSESSDHGDREHQKRQDEYRRLEILRAEQQIIKAKREDEQRQREEQRVNELRLREEQRLKDKALSLGITVDDVHRQENKKIRKHNRLVLKVVACVVAIGMMIIAVWLKYNEWYLLILAFPVFVVLYRLFSIPIRKR